ncbi:MAG: hsp70 family protein [Proteobacteria bacterium]|nr:hsp70 family protein [Pseudomonadota bacterium]
MSARGARFIVGIDLGTTHTVAAYADTDALAGAVSATATGPGANAGPAIEILAIPQLTAPGEVDHRPLLPSARYHHAEGEVKPADLTLPWGGDEHAPCPGVVGSFALSAGSKVPGRLVVSAKSWLSHPSVDRNAAILPWGSDRSVSKISPVDASACTLRHVASAWNLAHPRYLLAEQEVVLTVPASFDEAARALTLEAARRAGLPRLRLVEEPQAAFYHWLDRHRANLEEQLADQRLVIVVDVGGGTTDLTLIQVEPRDSGPRLTRIAVGDHLMLGGDNMDLALAHASEPRIARGAELGAIRFAQLVQQCRLAKERLLSGQPEPDPVRVTVLGSGSKLVGAARSTEVTQQEVERLVLDGFFPKVAAGARPDARRSAIVEFGLPYVADAAITKHMAAFVADHAALARKALGPAAPSGNAPVVPDTILLNGGVFRSPALATRLLEVVASWRSSAPRLLRNDAPELAVARGAVAYGLARRGLGLRIGGGSARSYFLLLGQADNERRGVCLLPRGSEEGEEVLLPERTFSLKTGTPVRFSLVSSSQDVRHHGAGDLVSIAGSGFVDLPPLAAVLSSKAGGGAGEIPVQLVSALTEIGTLELGCVARDNPAQRWKLELVLRGKQPERLAAGRVTQLHPRFAQATEQVRLVYGKSSQAVQPRHVKTLRATLEKLLGPRSGWDTPLLRELFGALWAGARRRRRSAAHERVWLNLTGYSMRPGFGYPLDDWRVGELWTIFESGVEFMPESQNHAEWWILWRRAAGGLGPEQQGVLLDVLEWYLRPPATRPRKRPAGPKWLGYDNMLRLAGSLEHIDPQRKEKVGDWLIERLLRHDEGAQAWWSVGRIGARVPFYGSAHNVVPRATAERWLQTCLQTDWRRTEHAAFAAVLLCRKSGDRERDLSSELRERVLDRLSQRNAPATWQRMLREVTLLEGSDANRVFGESLPPGLRLIE